MSENFLGYGDFSDVYLEESRGLSIHWEDGKVQSITQADDSGVGLRILNGPETRYAHTNVRYPFGPSFSERERQEMSRLEKQLTEKLKFKKPRPLAPPAVWIHPVLDPPSAHSLPEKIRLLRNAYDVAGRGRFIRQISLDYLERWKKIGGLNSLGQSFIEERTYLVFRIIVTVGKGGDLQTAYEALGGLAGFEIFKGGALEKMARLVSNRAHQKLEAPRAPVGEMPVVIAASAGGTLIHEAVGHSLEADAVLEGTSPAYAGKLGRMVANEKLTVLDDPTLPSARGSFYLDDEGHPSERTVLIEKGVLKNYLFDRKSALSARNEPDLRGLVERGSNGHGRRESYEHPPIPRMSNTFVAPGRDDPREIVASLKNGLLVTKMGGGQVNTANGDFVFDVEEGYAVKNGKKRLVRGATLLGNGPEVLKTIDKVGSDIGWAIGTCGKEGQGVPVSDGLPTVHIKKLVIGGQ
ncbi:MAG: TldD/PmbA family protein [Elusimicrobia bacterium]|nr:TldD/PmbA family protein [Candidatus Obscuribacterium magneticum]